MAETCIALLRGINVGTAKRISMAELRDLVESLGFRNSRTLLNSGNVVFTAAKAQVPKAAEKIQAAIENQLGVAANVMVVSAAELAAIVQKNPLLPVADNPSRLMVSVVADAAAWERLGPVLKKDWGPEKIAAGPGHSFYMWLPVGVIESPLNKEVSKLLKDAVTARNWATIQKLHAMALQAEEG